MKSGKEKVSQPKEKKAPVVVAQKPTTPSVKKKTEQTVAKGKEFTGKVVSAKMKDTVIVVIDRVIVHPLYKKAIRRTKRLSVHVGDVACEVGNTVTIREVRPISKTKHFIVVKKGN